MKKKLIIVIALILILTALTFAGCNDNGGGGGDTPTPPNPPQPQPPQPEPEVISVAAKQSSVTIHEKVFADFDFTSLFVITIDGQQIMIQSEYLDLSHLPQNSEEDGYVTCTYKDQSATCTVSIQATKYAVELAQKEIVVTQLQIDENFDFLALFTVTEDDEAVEITSDMVANNVKRDVGDYTVSVTFHNITKTLRVHVKEAHLIEIVNSYKVLQLEKAQLASFDFTSLFSLYLDGEVVRITEDMLDLSALQNVEEGNEYDVKLSYSYMEDSEESVAKVKIVAPKTVVLTASDIVTYPNGGFIDLTSLFTIKDGDVNVPVTIEMISGSIDYSSIGVNEITLAYKGQTATATVEVKRGVVINMPKGDTIIVKKGTNKNEYDFANDVSVIVNGLKFSFVTYGNGAAYHMDTTNVDFDTVGSYSVEVKIPYKFDSAAATAVTQTIHYVVKENTYQLSVVEDEVLLAKGTTSYNVFKNVNARINGIRRALIADKEIAKEDDLTVWAKLLSDPVDFNAVGVQHVRIAVYVEGVDSDPVEVEFTVRIKSNVSVEPKGKVVFGGDTVYTRDLFEIKDGTDYVQPTADMLEGKVDTFTPGVYTVKIDYLGLQAVATVVVLSDDIVGTYKTNMTTIPAATSSSGSDSWEVDDGYGDYGDGDDYEEVVPVTPLKDMTIARDGSITVDGRQAYLTGGIDQSTLIVSIGTTKYTMHLNNGIVVLDPDNDNRMSFTDSRRPLVYFNSAIWNLNKRVVVNYGKDYVLSNTYTSYSFDTFEIERKDTEQKSWFALYVKLVAKNAADTVYNVSWGEANYPEGFTPAANVSSKLTFDGKEYNFTMSTSVTAKVDRDTENTSKYAGMTFKGTVNGQDARLTANSKDAFELKIDSTVLFSVSKGDFANMKNGGVNYDTDTLTVYAYQDDFYSYKIKLDVENGTFELLEKDALVGAYVYDGKILFLDGYGTGVAKMNPNSYLEVKLSYSQNANEIVVNFIDAPYDFAYGEKATFYLATFGNILTVKQMDSDELQGVDFVNSHVTNGAMVTLDQTRFVKGNQAKVRPAILAAIHIVTKDGELDDTAKASCVNLGAIRYNNAGFYQISVTMSFGQESLTSYYAIQIIGPIDSQNEFVANYGKGLIDSGMQLEIDANRMLTLTRNTDKYQGFVNISGNGFYSKVTFGGSSVVLTGEKIADGLLMVRGSGAMTFIDYFALGTSSVAAGKGAVLRKVAYNSNVTYLFATSLASPVEIIDEITTIDGIGTNNGAIVSFTSSKKSYVVKIAAWGNTVDGLLVSDSYRGEYTRTGEDTVKLDGFGNVEKGGTKGTYKANANGSILAKIGEDMFVIDLNSADMTYAPSSIVLDETLLKGKSYTATYLFSCPNTENQMQTFKAVTTFAFGENGQVIVTSESSEHDSGDNACGDRYNPSFASKDGVSGTYSVSGTTVTVRVVGSAVFTFEISDVSVTDEIVCTDAKYSNENEQGVFEKNTKFSIE